MVYAGQFAFVKHQPKCFSLKKCQFAYSVHRRGQMITFDCHVVAKSGTQNAMAASEVQKSEKSLVTLKKRQVQSRQLLNCVSKGCAR